MSRPRVHLAAMLLLLSALWGIAFVAIKELLREVSPITLTLLRFAVAAASLLLLIAVSPRARPRIPRHHLPRVLLLGAVGVPGYHLALNWGEQRASASVAALIVATAPVMVALLAATILRERLTMRRIAGIALAFGGVAVLAVTSRSASGAHATTLSGVLVTLLAPACWAVYTVAARPLTRSVPPLQLTVAAMAAGCLFLVPAVRAETFREAAALSGRGWTWVVVLGAGSSVAGYVIFTWALSKLGPTRTAVTLYLVPVVALVAAWAILGDPIDAWVALAAALVVAGVWLAQRDRPVPPQAPDQETLTPIARPTP